MKKSTIIGGVIFLLVFGLTIYTAIVKYAENNNEEEKKKIDREVLVGSINVNIEDLDNIKKSKSTNYNIEILNNVENYIKNNIDFNTLEVNEYKTINSNDIVKNDDCTGNIKIYKLIDGIYSVSISSNCKNDSEGNYFSFKLFGNLNNNANIYKVENIDGDILAASYKSNGSKNISSSIIKFNDDLNIEWVYDIDDKSFEIREDNGLKVEKILKNNDSYYIIGYLNDDFGSVFGIKLDKNGNQVWKKKISSEMIISDVFISSNELVITDGSNLNYIDNKGNIRETLELDLYDSKLSNYRLGRTIYYNGSIYGSNNRKIGGYAKFNSSGLVDGVYDVEHNIDVSGYLDEIKGYDNKLFFNYDDGNILVLDVFGRYVGNIKNDSKISKLVINKSNFDVINYDNYFRIDSYKYNLEKEKTYELLNVSNNKNNIFSTDKYIYQYLCDKNYIVLAQFDK